ncbi:MAG: hypothetical protein KKC18_13520, partial [Chloroflexi bacterium]|nr:hypothetical protein [Chloroflexota bacterium]
MTKNQFIPGNPAPPRAPLARYRPAQPAGAVSAYVRSLTQPGDLVVDLFCQGPTVVREAVAAGRRALGFSVNPLLLVAARLGLSQYDPDALNAAFTRLADSLKGDVPLRHHLTALYRSACPACGEMGVAEWFAWDRDGNYPFKKAVRCPECAGLQEGTPDDQDLQATHRVQPRGLAYYYALDRVAPPDHPARERATELVKLYTPRNLSALMDLSRRLESLETDDETRTALTGVLLDCCDAGSNLDPYGEERSRPRTLRTPSLYLERNVWLRFKEGFTRFLAEEVPPLVERAADVAALAGDETTGYALVARAARDAREVIRPGSAKLVFTDPPQPDGPFWALSALWAGWLWESPAARAMRPFLRRRRFDWDWHWRALQAALKATGPLLAPTGHLVTLFSGPDDALLESVCLAASGAGYALEGWGYSPEIGHRLVWRWKPQEARSRTQEAAVGVEDLERELAAVAEEAVAGTLREREEPTGRATLHSAACAALAESGLLASAAAIPKGESPLTLTTNAVRRALDSAPLTQITDKEDKTDAMWWLADPSRAAETLADRVDEMVWELLIQPAVSQVEPQRAWREEELVNAVYAHFPGPLTPDLKLVQVCIDSYSVRAGQTLRLRPEDDPLRRAAELGTLRNDLADLGKRLGFEVKQRDSWDVRWLEGEQELYLFAISTQAALGRHLLARRAAGEGVQRCLVVPGGRAQLVGLKLQRDPRLARAVAADGWQFVKFRHLRRLVAEEELDRHALKTVLGLDPIAEQ